MKFITLCLLVIGVCDGVYNKAIINDNVCLEILDDWWASRKSLIGRIPDTRWDKVCIGFNGDADACYNRKKGSRDEYIKNGTLENEDADVPCQMIGIRTSRCIGNICNNYNTDKCTVQNTGGFCVWHTKEDVEKFGVEYGCHRNLCNLGGYGRSPQECPGKGIPGMYKCTWCYGNGRLRGEAMGCQMTTLRTKSQCAPVGSPGVPKSSIWVLTRRAKCQCSDRSLFCSDDVKQLSTLFKRKFP